MSEIVLTANTVAKIFADVGETIKVFDDVTFSVNAEESVAIVGSSGSGKSTLLHLLGGLEQPSQGEIEVLGQYWNKMTTTERAIWRNQHIGFVYQFHHLLTEFKAIENVALPLLIARTIPQHAFSRAEQLLLQLGLSARLSHLPSQLSGGERQRVAIARALVTHPRIVLADEPTGNLDHANAEQVFSMLLAACKQYRTALVLVTHDVALARRCDRVLCLNATKLEVSSNT